VSRGPKVGLLFTKTTGPNCESRTTSPKVGSVFLVDSTYKSPVHSWRAKVLVLILAYINIVIFIYTTIISATKPAFPEPAEDSITDKGVFLTSLALLASRNVVSDSEQRYILPCYVYGLGKRRKTGKRQNIRVGTRRLLVQSDSEELLEAFHVKCF